jgi:predicted AlkP superfamily pyrophosphatase or phosphodiesterase
LKTIQLFIPNPMRIKTLFFASLVLTTFTTNAQPAKSQLPAKNTSLPRPKLVVGLMVDQMRWDYLYRFYNRYENGGFKRMLNEGFSCENAYINYVPSVTGIGHATVYTGHREGHVLFCRFDGKHCREQFS